MSCSFWRTSARLAWRNLKGSRARAVFITGAMSVSIASVTAVYGVAALARATLGRDSRVWLASDLAVETTEPISGDQIAALDQMRRDGIDWTLLTWTMTVATSDQSPDPVFMGVEAVDPAVYPFYGTRSLDPPRRLADVLAPDTVVLSENALERLHVRAGDRIRIGGQSFAVAGVIAAEPERFNGILGWGPRCILSRQAFERIGAAGNAVMSRILLRLPAGSDLGRVRGRLQALVPEGRALDYREAAAPEVARLELTLSFLSVIAFLVLALGATGVAVAVRLNLDQRMETLAIMRVAGARTSQMASLFLIETAALVAGGLALGIPLGWGMKMALLSLAAKYLVLPGSAGWGYAAILQSALAVAAMMAPLLAGPLNAVWRLKPLPILRRDAPEARAPLRLARPLFAGAAVIACVAAGGIAYRMIQAWKPALFLVTAMAASAGLAWMMAAFALRRARGWTSSRLLAPVLKHALIRLHRSGNQMLILIVCVALGVMVITGTFEAGSAVVKTVSSALPYPSANLLVAEFDDFHRNAVRMFLETQPGVEGVEMLTQVWLRLAKVDGAPIAGPAYLAQCAGSTAETGAGGVVIADDLAVRAGVRTGSVLAFETRDGPVQAIVGAIRHPRPEERFWLTFIVDCRGLPRSSLIEAAAVRVRADRVEAVRRAVHARFPTLAAITSEDILSTIRGVTEDALTVVRLTTLSAAAAGLLVLMTVVAASRAARSREIGILVALGATRGTMLKIYSLEFAAAGLLSAAIGSLLACGFNSVILTVLFYRPEVVVDWRALAGAMLISPLVTVAAGWAPTYRLLHRRPMEILRHE